jgi:UDP-N-acetylmuramyl pentapeptide phosphotransferase/UDP-N-acetylglucosamine-1-phosphate transferase
MKKEANISFLFVLVLVCFQAITIWGVATSDRIFMGEHYTGFIGTGLAILAYTLRQKFVFYCVLAMLFCGATNLMVFTPNKVEEHHHYYLGSLSVSFTFQPIFTLFLLIWAVLVYPRFLAEYNKIKRFMKKP